MLHSSFGERKQHYWKHRSLSLSLASLDDPELDRLSKEAYEVDFLHNMYALMLNFTIDITLLSPKYFTQ